MNFPNKSILDSDNGPTGFATDDFQFAAIPCGKKYMILVNGQQLELVKTRQLAEIRLEQLKNSHPKLNKGTSTPTQPKRPKKSKTPSGSLEFGETKPEIIKKPVRKLKSKSVPVKKLATFNSSPLLDALS